MELNIKKPEFKTINFNEPEEMKQNCFLSKSLDRYNFTFLKQICHKGVKKITKRSGHYLDLDITNNEYLKFIYDLDEYFIGYVSKKSDEWFGINMDENKISDFYISSLLENTNGYCIRVKLPLRANKSLICIKDAKGNRIDIHRFPEEDSLISGNFVIKGLKFLKNELIVEYEASELILHNPLPRVNLTDILSDKIGVSANNSNINSEDDEDYIYQENIKTGGYSKDNNLDNQDISQYDNNKDIQNNEPENNINSQENNDQCNKQNYNDQDEDENDKYEIKLSKESKESKDDISQIIRGKKQLLSLKKNENENNFQEAEDLSEKINTLRQNAVKSAREIRELESELSNYSK